MKNKNKINITLPMSDHDKLLVIETFNKYFDYTSIHDPHQNVYNIMVRPVLRPMPMGINLEGSFEDIINDMLDVLVKEDKVNTMKAINVYCGPGSWT